MEWLGSQVFWAWMYVVSQWTIRLTMLVIVPLRRPPAAANSWLLLILFEPYVGLALYFFIGNRRLPRGRAALFARLPETFATLRERLLAHPNVFHPTPTPELSPAVTLAENLGRMPILGGNSATVLAGYDNILDRLIADIDTAKQHVHLLYYIFADDSTANRVVQALERAVKRGVKCRVLIDSMGSRKPLRTLLPKLRALGVETHELLPLGLFRRKMGRLDLRNHRKIAVIDGRVGYTGSQNLVDAKFKAGITYEEVVVRVTGPIVLELQFLFASDWFVETQEALHSEDVFPDPEVTGAVAAQVLPSGPSYSTENTQRLVVALAHGARERIVITTPYFIPDEPLLQALQTAALRGVEVHLVVSEKEDQLLVSLAQKSYYGALLDAGVKIHLYRLNFLHAKHLSIDDHVAMIGSSNMDIRSFALNAEVSMLLYDRGVTTQLRKEQERYFANCVLLDPVEWRRRPFLKKTFQYLARLMSPLL